MTQEERIDQLLEAVEQLIAHTQALNKRIDDFFSTKIVACQIQTENFDPWAAPSWEPNNTP